MHKPHLRMRPSAASRHASTSAGAYPFPTHARPTPHQIFHLPIGATQKDIKARCRYYVNCFISVRLLRGLLDCRVRTHWLINASLKTTSSYGYITQTHPSDGTSLRKRNARGSRRLLLHTTLCEGSAVMHTVLLISTDKNWREGDEPAQRTKLRGTGPVLDTSTRQQNGLRARTIGGKTGSFCLSGFWCVSSTISRDSSRNLMPAIGIAGHWCRNRSSPSMAIVYRLISGPPLSFEESGGCTEGSPRTRRREEKGNQ